MFNINRKLMSMDYMRLIKMYDIKKKWKLLEEKYGDLSDVIIY